MDVYRLARAAAGTAWLLGTVLLSRRNGLPVGRTFLLALGTFIGGWVGARLHAQLFEVGLPIDVLWTDPLRLVRAPGHRLAGGMLAGTIVVVLGCRLLRLQQFAFSDATAPVAGLALAIGRLGCFMAGCCSGRISDLPWALRYPPGNEAHSWHVAAGLIAADATLSLPVHPLPLYFALVGLLAFALPFSRHVRFPGERGLLVVVVLGFGHAVVETLRDTTFQAPVPLRTEAPLIAACAATIALLVIHRRGLRDEAARSPQTRAVCRDVPHALAQVAAAERGAGPVT